MAIVKRPSTVEPDQAAIESFIAGGLDKAAAQPAEPETAGGGRKKSISLTLDPALLHEIDQTAKSLGISRAAAFSLGMSRFVASEKRGAQ